MVKGWGRHKHIIRWRARLFCYRGGSWCGHPQQHRWTSPAASVDIPSSIGVHARPGTARQPQRRRWTCPARSCPTSLQGPPDIPAGTARHPCRDRPTSLQVLPADPSSIGGHARPGPARQPRQRRWTCPAASVDIPADPGRRPQQRLWTSQQILADDPSSRLDDYNSCYRSSMLSPRLPSFSPHYIRILVL